MEKQEKPLIPILQQLVFPLQTGSHSVTSFLRILLDEGKARAHILLYLLPYPLWTA